MRICLTLLIILFLNQLIFAQAPTINTFSPVSGPVGTAVTITGNGFSTTPSDNIVFFGAVKAIVTNASPSSLTVTVPAGATFEPIKITVNGLTAFAAQPFIVTFVGGAFGFTTNDFASKIDYAAGNGTACIVSGDLDGDGQPDLIAANATSNTISVFRNVSSTGAIALSSKIDITTGNKPYCVTVGDLDGDGKPDLAVANGTSNNLSIFRNTSTGAGVISFAPKIDLATGNFPFCVVIGDFDGDGKPDLASANSTSNTVSIFKNNGTIGAFSFSAKTDFVTGVSPFWLTVGDFDNDGKPDLAVANGATSNSVSVLRNASTAGNISFATKVDFDGGVYSFGIASGDIDGDGKLDLTIANNDVASVAILLNKSNGTGNISFGQKSLFQSSNSAFGATIGDMDGDGKPDVVMANSASNTVSVLRNRSRPGVLTLDQKVDFLVGTNPWVSAVVDLDGDGKPDIATANQQSANISVIRNKLGDLKLVSFDPVSGGNGSTVNITGKNFDNITGVYFGNIPATSFDVVSQTKIVAKVGSGSSGKVLVIGSKGKDSLNGFIFDPAPAISSFYPTFGGTGTVVNIVGINFNTVTSVRFGNSIASSFVINSPTSISAIVGSTDSLILTVKVQNPTAIASADGFYSGPSITSFYPQSGPAGTIVTINGHHFNTIFSKNTVHFGTAKAIILEATSTVLKVVAPANATFEPISVAQDSLITYSKLPFSITFPLTNTGFDANSLMLKGDSATGQYPNSIAKADFDQDGKTDLAILNHLSASFSILKNTSQTGFISFDPKVDFTTILYPSKLITGDMNGDGKTDVIVLNNYANSFSIFKNTSVNGVISFQESREFMMNNPASDICITDIDIDGKPDVILLQDELNRITVHKNVKDSFAFSQRWDVYSPDATSIAIGDIDADGKNDIILSGDNGSFTVIKNKSISGKPFTNSMFEKFTIVSQGSISQGVAIGDFNSDNMIDIATGNKGSESITVNTNSSTLQQISFSNVLEYPFGNSTSPSDRLNISVADMDGNGKADIIFPGFTNNNFILKNNGVQNTTSFMSPISNHAGFVTNFYGQLAVADLDGDGKPDVSSIDHATNRVYFFRNRAGEHFSMCNEGNTVLNTNLSGSNYQWQLNTGNGFTDIVDDLHFSNSNSASLSLNNIPSSWYINEYRCVVDGNNDIPISLDVVNYWTGSVSSDWNNPFNWSCSKIPDNNTDVVINSGAIIINSDITIRSLTVKPGVTVTVNPGFNLKILH